MVFFDRRAGSASFSERESHIACWCVASASGRWDPIDAHPDRWRHVEYRGVSAARSTLRSIFIQFSIWRFSQLYLGSAYVGIFRFGSCERALSSAYVAVGVLVLCIIVRDDGGNNLGKRRERGLGSLKKVRAGSGSVVVAELEGKGACARDWMQFYLQT